MGGLIESLKQSVIGYVTALPDDEDLDPTSEDDDIETTYSLTTFKDNVTFRGTTKEKSTLISQVSGLYASGGDDCPEESLGGLSRGVASFDSLVNYEKAPKDVLLITDASAHDGDVSGIIQAAKEKSTRVNVLLTGNCGLAAASLRSGQGQQSQGRVGTTKLSAQELSSYSTFKRIAEETGGQFTYMPNGTTEDYTQAIGQMLRATSSQSDNRPLMNLYQLQSYSQQVQIYETERKIKELKNIMLVKVDNAIKLTERGNLNAAANQLDFLNELITEMAGTALNPLDSDYILRSMLNLCKEYPEK